MSTADIVERLAKSLRPWNVKSIEETFGVSPPFRLPLLPVRPLLLSKSRPNSTCPGSAGGKKVDVIKVRAITGLLEGARDLTEAAASEEAAEG